MTKKFFRAAAAMLAVALATPMFAQTTTTTAKATSVAATATVAEKCPKECAKPECTKDRNECLQAGQCKKECAQPRCTKERRDCRKGDARRAAKADKCERVKALKGDSANCDAFKARRAVARDARKDCARRDSSCVKRHHDCKDGKGHGPRHGHHRHHHGQPATQATQATQATATQATATKAAEATAK